MTVYVPHDIQETWVNTDQIGLSQQLQFTDQKTLFLLIEKDFKYNDVEGSEDQSDFYDHPVKNC